MRVRYHIGPDATVEAGDRGLAYGDGLFETMAVRDGRIERWSLHRQRLTVGMERLSMPLPDLIGLEQRLDALAKPLERGTAKLIVTRGTGPRGYAPPTEPALNVILSAEARSAAPNEAIDAVILEQRLGENRELAGIKHLCRLEQVLGQLELQQSEADEGVMLSVSGDVIGGTSRNLFAVFGERIVTPELTLAGIRGVMRQAVLDLCDEQQSPVEERPLQARELYEADEIFMTNALVGVQSVRRLDGREYGTQVVAQRLRFALS